MKDQTQDSFHDNKFNIIVNLHPNNGILWVLVIRRDGCEIYYFDNLDFETPPLFLEKHIDLGSDEKIQEYEESCCAANCLYMIYVIDRGYRVKSNF